MSIKSLLNSLTGTGRDPSSLGLTGDTAKTIPDASYLEQMQNLLKGDLSSSLTSGEKLMALGALLRSAGRGSQTTPQEVMGEIRKTAQNRTATQLQLAQLQAAAAQKAQQRNLISEFAGALDNPQQKQALLALGEDKAAEQMAQVAFRPRQVQQIVADQAGNSRIIFGDGTTGTLDFKMERGSKWIQADPTGSGATVLLLVDDKTGKPVLDADGKMQTMAMGSSWVEMQRIAQGWENVRLRGQEANNAGASSGATRSTPVQITDDKGKPRIVQWNKNDQAYYEVGTGKRVTRGPSSTSGWKPSISLTPGKPKYGAR